MQAPLSYNQLEKTASKLLSLTGQKDDRSTDVVSVAKNIGYEVILARFDEDIRGMVVCDDKERAIYVNKDDNPSQKKFTVAREISRILLHASEDDKYFVDYRKKITYDVEEYETNNFAAAIIMPKEATIRTWQKVQKVEHFAEEMGVSNAVAVIRLTGLGLLAL